MIDNDRLIKAWEIFRNSNPYEICDGREFRAMREPEYCMGQMVEDTIALLKEQEPLEPMKIEIEQAGPLYHRCYCLKCGHHVGNMIMNKVTDTHENFCSNCGQKVKWE